MRELGVGLLGCGTVGTGVIRLLNDAGLAERVGAALSVRAVVVRDLERDRDPVVPVDCLTDDLHRVIDAPDIDIVVEVMGGIDPAHGAIEKALSNGKQVVTANKALLALHGDSLFALAQKNSADLLFEASAAGGVPVVRALRESLASDRVVSIHGIINGTSNYVLTRMETLGESLDDAVTKAQEAGYAEADPSFDVGGQDAAQKLQVLSALAFGLSMSTEVQRVQGIDSIQPADFTHAASFGYRIKPLAVARGGENAVESWVGPALVPMNHVLAGVNDVFNACYLKSEAVGPLLFYGQGAGMMPTAMSVVSDVIEAGRKLAAGAPGGSLPAVQSEAVADSSSSEPQSVQEQPWYLRLCCRDQPGVLGRVAATLGGHGVSINKLVQKNAADASSAEVVILTHVAGTDSVRAAVAEIDNTADTTQPTLIMPVEDPA